MFLFSEPTHSEGRQEFNTNRLTQALQSATIEQIIFERRINKANIAFQLQNDYTGAFRPQKIRIYSRQSNSSSPSFGELSHGERIDSSRGKSHDLSRTKTKNKTKPQTSFRFWLTPSWCTRFKWNTSDSYIKKTKNKQNKCASDC